MGNAAPAELFHQARAAWSRGDYATAGTLCDQILKKKRNDFNALMLRANVSGAIGQLTEEIALVSAAVRLQPKNARLRVHLGQRFLSAGELTKAMTQFEKALRLEPRLPEAMVGQAQVHEGRNKYDAARRLLTPLLAGDNPAPNVATVFLRVLLHEKNLDEAIAVGRRVIDAGHPPSLALRSTCFALAKAHERRGDYAEAIEVAKRAHGMRAEPYDPAAATATVDALIATFTKDAVASLPRPAAPSELPIFILGMPRTGSTLTERIIHTHPDAHGAGEIDTLLPIINTLPSRLSTPLTWPQWATALTPDEVEAASREYLDQLRRFAPKARRISNKYLGHFMHLGLLNVLFPAGRVIHCRRNAVDTCLSCFMERLSPGQAPFAQTLETLGFQYLLYERLMDHWRETLDIAFLEVDYETLIDDQEGVTRRILEFCDLPWDDACLRFHETTRADGTISFDQVRKPLYRTALGRAERFGPLLDPLRKALGR